jgi:CRISPR-associated endonuclease Csn1
MSLNTNGYTLGLDIGIGSVGWGIIDEERNIVDAGVRLFPEADGSNNESRRSTRGARRLKRRRRHRLDRIESLLKENHIWPEHEKFDKKKSTQPYELRRKGLYEKLTKEELTIALRHLGKRRGIHNVEVAEDEKTDGASTKEQIKQNDQLLKNHYVCEAQLILREQEGSIRGLKNRFKTSDYVNEARKILTTQQEFYPKEVTDEFISSYISLIETRREYFDGPGKESPYGWYEGDKPSQEKWFENMVGKCSYFPEEFRSVKQAYSAQLFNLLNDLNNLTITRAEEPKLTTEEKKEIVETVFKAKKGSPTLKKIAKTIDVKEEDIKGFRIKKNNTPEFTDLKIYKDIAKITVKEEIIENPEVLDKITWICTIYQTPTHRLEKLIELDLPISEEKLEQISELNYGGTHRLSLKLIQYMLPDLWDTSKNQMEILTEQGLKPKDVDYSGRKYLPYNHINEMVLSPVVRRSLIQTIRVINGVIKQYGTPKEIVIELARESNSEDKRRFINQMQKENEALNKEVRAKLEAAGKDGKGIFHKLRLWHLQDGLCAYSLKPIKIEELLDNPTHYEVDHVIPRSVSFDDSMNNKVLVHRDENQQKGNRTPFQYMSSGQYAKFRTQVLSWYKAGRLKRKKRDYLLEERDINKYDVQKEFINRNLVDTRYTTREIMTMVRQFFVSNDQEVKVKSINGSFTNYLRKLWDFPKDRGVDFKHHAEDALIVAMAGFIFEHKDTFAPQRRLLDEGKVVHKETAEILDEKEYASEFADKWEKVKAIKNYVGYKYSHKVDMKPNRQLFNETIFSTRTVDEDEFIINKHKNIYDPDYTKLKKMVFEKPEKLLMYKHDHKTFEKLLNVMEKYREAKNPLHQYHEETGEYLTKYAKNNNGPVIKSVKYIEKKLGIHYSITDKYQTESKNVVFLSMKPFRIDVYYEENRYKFVTVRYSDLKETSDRYILEKDTYSKICEGKNINDRDNFLFSLHKNEVFVLNGEVLRLIGTNDDGKNKIEANEFTNNYRERANREDFTPKQLFKTIGQKTEELRKLHFDILGNVFENKNEKIKWEYPK